jgi:hypothetical protein
MYVGTSSSVKAVLFMRDVFKMNGLIVLGECHGDSARL